MCTSISFLTNNHYFGRNPDAVKKGNLIDMPFNEQFPVAPLHWMISDEEKTIASKPTENGVMVYRNAFVVYFDPSLPLIL